MDKLLFLGNSHMGAFVAAGQDPSQAETEFRFLKITDPRYAPSLKNTGNGSAFGGVLGDELAAARADGFEIVSCIGGNAHNVIGMVQHPDPYDFVLPTAPDMPLTAGAQVVPYRLVKARLAAAVIGQLKNLMSLAATGPVQHIESPPPIYSDDWVLKNGNRLFQDNGLGSMGVSPAHLRYKLWDLHSQIFEETAAANGVTFVKSPAGVKDDHGYLREDFSSNDATHANRQYGLALLTEIKSNLAMRSADASV